MIAFFIFLQADGSATSMLNYLPMVAIFAVIYFFFIRPQAKKQKAQEKFSNSLERGMEIVTTSGILGKISKIEEHVVTLQLDQKTFIRVLASSISKEMTDTLNK